MDELLGSASWMGMGAADPWSGVPYDAGGGFGNMAGYNAPIPGSGAYSAPDWFAGSPFGSQESQATPSSPSAVPGTSGAPPYTPSATPGGVNSGAGTGMPGSPYGDLAGGLTP